MKIKKLLIEGSWLFEFDKFKDNRGFFFESFRADKLYLALNRRFEIKQTNTSISSKGSLRGIHYALLSPSQAKFIQCLRGAIKDYVIDLRIGSPTFGQFDIIQLDENSAQAIFIEEGLAHAFVALEDKTIVTYYVSEKYNPEKEKGVNPLDKTLNIQWPKIDLIISEKDKSALTLLEAQEKNLLPDYMECQKFIKTLHQ